MDALRTTIIIIIFSGKKISKSKRKIEHLKKTAIFGYDRRKRKKEKEKKGQLRRKKRCLSEDKCGKLLTFSPIICTRRERENVESERIRTSGLVLLVHLQ